MKKSLIFIKIFVSVFLLLISTNLYAKKAAIIVDYDTQEVLFEVNADTLNYPASLTKIMTLYIVFDYLDKNKLNWETQLNVSATAASRSPSKLYLKEGSTISVKNAVMALIIKSANDVATVVAENISGTEREFAKLMTKYAKKLSMNSTTFKNASGLPNRAQLTTARDVYKLAHALISHFPNEYKLFKNEKFVWMDKTYKTNFINIDSLDKAYKIVSQDEFEGYYDNFSETTIKRLRSKIYKYLQPSSKFEIDFLKNIKEEIKESNFVGAFIYIEDFCSKKNDEFYGKQYCEAVLNDINIKSLFTDSFLSNIRASNLKKCDLNNNFFSD